MRAVDSATGMNHPEMQVRGEVKPRVSPDLQAVSGTNRGFAGGFCPWEGVARSAGRGEPDTPAFGRKIFKRIDNIFSEGIKEV